MKGMDLNELRAAKDFDKIHNKMVKWVIHDNFQRGNFSQDNIIFFFGLIRAASSVPIMFKGLKTKLQEIMAQLVGEHSADVLYYKLR